MVFIHVIRGRPSGLVQFPAGEAVKICFASVSSGIRAMCPNRDRRLDWTGPKQLECHISTTKSDDTLASFRSLFLVPVNWYQKLVSLSYISGAGNQRRIEHVQFHAGKAGKLSRR